MSKIMLIIISMISFAPFVAVTDSIASNRQQPENRMVIIIDGSGSFRNQQVKALEKLSSLVERMDVKQLERWEKDNDRVIIISLDAIPDVIFEGTVDEFKNVDEPDWVARFKARQDLSYCTDVAGAFRLAVRKLSGDPRFVSKYLVVFSDLIHEPPTTSVTKCTNPVYGPLENFPWESLSDTSVTIYWAPANQKLLWQRAAEKHGLEEAFLIYSSESEAMELKVPPKAQAPPMTEEEMAATRAQIDHYQEKGWALIKSILKYTGLIILALVVFSVLLGMITRWRRRRRIAQSRTTGNNQDNNRQQR